ALQGAAGKEQMAAAPGAGALRSRVPGRPAENGLRRADRGMDPRAVARVGGAGAGAVGVRRRGIGVGGAGAAGVARAPRRHAQLAISVVDGADARGVAREVGLKVRMRPRRILHVITDLYLAGAETMLTRLAAAQPGLADETMVVSLLPGGFHTERLRAAGVRPRAGLGRARADARRKQAGCRPGVDVPRRPRRPPGAHAVGPAPRHASGVEHPLLEPGSVPLQRQASPGGEGLRTAVAPA